MRMLGVIGGTSWQSTAVYYRLLNEGVEARLGRPHSARLIMASLDFADIEPFVRSDDWSRLDEVATEAARALRAAGAQALMIASNTIQRAADAAGAAAGLHVLHLTDITADELQRRGLRRAGVLGTAMTMQGPFYAARLSARHGCEVIVPDAAGQAEVNRVIFEELIYGVVSDASRQAYRRIMADLAADGAQAILLACTELMLLVDETDATVPVIDTTALHVQAGLDWALG
ncbi:MAG TPA: amino acid racemase [Caulobacteraceae bacterium]|jgi:aspartate racemase|nr:amino acid racemase [Caulobacteraceae bacterium]